LQFAGDSPEVFILMKQGLAHHRLPMRPLKQTIRFDKHFGGISEIVVDTLLICSTTAFVVLVSGVWKANDAKAQSAALTARAFENSFGEFGSMMVSISMMFFVFSTVIVVIFYGSRMAEFLF